MMASRPMPSSAPPMRWKYLSTVTALRPLSLAVASLNRSNRSSVTVMSHPLPGHGWPAPVADDVGSPRSRSGFAGRRSKFREPQDAASGHVTVPSSGQREAVPAASMAASRNLWRPEPRKIIPMMPMIIQPPGTRSVNALAGVRARAIGLDPPADRDGAAMVGDSVPASLDSDGALDGTAEGTSAGGAAGVDSGATDGDTGVSVDWARSVTPRLDPVVAVRLTVPPPRTITARWPPPTIQSTMTEPVV